jgi:heptose-I-phosphate ethanolaminephosphotransferase
MTISDSQSVATCFQTPNIVEIAKLSGYKFTWISNQSEKGIHDNAITKFANLADTAIWNGNKFAGMRRINKDGELINILKHYKSDAQHNVILVHLMGSHESFYKRYPSEFGKFKSNQYLSYPQNQRTQRAQYDNSILYNDYVVSSIMELYANEDVAVIYFSDHGLDVFGSDPTYCAHARVGDEKSINFAKQIPFMIYTSSKFRANHGNLVGMIEKSVNKQYNTTDFPFMFMQLIGVTFKDRENKYPLQ